MVDTTAGEQDAREKTSGEKTVSPLLTEWKQKMDRLRELAEWSGRAEQELRSIPKDDKRWDVYWQVQDAAEKLETEIEQIQEKQTAALTQHLEGTGPLTLAFGDGTQCVVAAHPRTAGGTAHLLPADLLRVWRVAEVFAGSVVGHDATPQRLTFGDAQQIDWFKPKKRRR